MCSSQTPKLTLHRAEAAEAYRLVYLGGPAGQTELCNSAILPTHKKKKIQGKMPRLSSTSASMSDVGFDMSHGKKS